MRSVSRRRDLPHTGRWQPEEAIEFREESGASSIFGEPRVLNETRQSPRTGRLGHGFLSKSVPLNEEVWISLLNSQMWDEMYSQTWKTALVEICSIVA